MTDLPDDIIREIFLAAACLSGPASLPPRSYEPRLILSHVCASWREIALSTPRLWNEIKCVEDYSIPYDHSTRDVPIHPALQAWFSRSGQCLLSLQITRISRGLRPLFDEYVFPNLHRCRELKLLVTITLADQLFHSPGALHYLETMELEIIGPSARGGMQDIISHKPVTSFQVATRLRRVALFLDETYLDLPRLNLQWQHLVALVIKGTPIPATSFLGALRECTSLEECSISVANTHRRAAPGASLAHNRPIVLPSLHTIWLEFSVFYNGLSDFLTVLHFPGLRRFRLVAGITQFSLPTLQPFLAPASHNLEKLDISDIHWSSATELQMFLATLPHLTALRLSTSNPVPEEVLQELATGSINPRLTSIRAGTINMSSLLSFLEGRLLVSRDSGGAISNITSVSTSYFRPLSNSAEYARWVALKEAGIRIDWRYF
ncbi:hypothetical protein BD779DRAFT_1545316 [Infundibulicybe gibba]|nr:hypothetical protein BD779DRAFT_1545316 [Infundibulicybe gibba]